MSVMVIRPERGCDDIHALIDHVLSILFQNVCDPLTDLFFLWKQIFRIVAVGDSLF